MRPVLSMRRRGITRVDVVVFAEVIFIAFLFLAAGAASLSHSHHHSSGRTKCGNNLKQIGMAAIQYSDDKRFFPHIARLKDLDGGYKSDTASRAFRALVNFNYNDNPESFVCPDSPDQFTPMSQAARADIRAFRWSGADGAIVASSALAAAGLDVHDVPLDKSIEISYGWTRRGLTNNSVSTALLAADKARIMSDGDVPPIAQDAHKDNMVGNHRDCMIAVCVDAHTMRISPTTGDVDTKTISRAEQPKDGALGVLGDDPDLGQ